MKTVYVITHPEVVIDPNVPVPHWPLSEKGKGRMRGLLHAPWIKNVTAVYSSDEQKSIDGAMMIAHSSGVKVAKVSTLGEVDRSSTGYLPQEKHDLNARLLFDQPHESVEGWETAIEAQYRMVTTIYRILEFDKTPGPIVIMTHGAVASFLMSHLKRKRISLEDAPGMAGGGGIFSFDATTHNLLSDWQNIDDFAPKRPKSPNIPLGGEADSIGDQRV